MLQGLSQHPTVSVVSLTHSSTFQSLIHPPSILSCRTANGSERAPAGSHRRGPQVGSAHWAVCPAVLTESPPGQLQTAPASPPRLPLPGLHIARQHFAVPRRVLRHLLSRLCMAQCRRHAAQFCMHGAMQLGSSKLWPWMPPANQAQCCWIASDLTAETKLCTLQQGAWTPALSNYCKDCKHCTM